MAFFVGNLVVSVCGCSLDEVDGRLLDPCVELSVGNKLHSTSLQVGPCDDSARSGGGSGGGDRDSRVVEFHDVTELDALTVTVLDRSNSSNEDHDAFVAEAEPLLCTEWGLGARPVLRSCIVAPTEQHQPSIPQRLPSASTGVVREGAGRKGRVAEECAGTGRKHGGTSTIQLNICWSPKVRLRKPLSFLSDAGSRTWMLLSGKFDRPVSAVLNLILDFVGHAKALAPRWKCAAIVTSVTSISLASAFLVAISALFLPCTLAIAAAAVTLVPPTAALAWVLACTAPAYDHLWQPLIVWAGTRSATARKFLLLPFADGGKLGLERCDDARRSVAAAAATAAVDLTPPSGMATSRFQQGGYPDVKTSTGAGAVLMLTCYQNLMRILYTGLEGSRWRPHPRPR
ncbi:unnamed protein product [Sphacelaria rigidula]